MASALWETFARGCTYAPARIVIYSLACLTTSCIYFGWQAFSEMLLRQGAYAWECAPGEDFVSAGVPCEVQDKKITRLYSLAQGSEFICVAVGGLLFDTLGPRLTACLGELLCAGALLLLAYSGKSFQAYIPGILLSGAAVNVTAFPALTITEAWPKRQALAIAVIVGFQTGASIIAPILNALWRRHLNWTYQGIWWTYLAAVWLPVSLLYIWALPRNRDYTKLIESHAAETPLVATRDQSTVEELEEHTLKDSVDHEADLEVATETPQAAPISKPSHVWHEFWKELKTLDLFIMAVYFLLQMFQFAYYPAVLRDAVSQELSDYASWMTPVQAIFSMMIGFIMDYTGTVLVMFGMVLTLVWTSLTTALDPTNRGMMFVTATLFIFMQSATYNLKYTFVNETYDPYNFGKLVGLLGILGGVGVYLSGPITKSSDYKEVFLFLLIPSGVMLGLSAWLLGRQRKGIKHKTVQTVTQTHRKAAFEHPGPH